MSARFNRENMLEPILLADPAFHKAWAEFQDEWRHEQDQPTYLALSALARHLILNLEVGNTERFDAIFAIVEDWHTDGDSHVQGAVAIGLLEDLQNENLYSSGQPRAFEQWLRPASAQSWADLNAFWLGRRPTS